MNDDPRFDPVDDELRRRFREETPRTGDTDADADLVLDDLRPRLRRARTRRRLALSSALATAAAVVILVVFALAGGGGTGSVRTPPATGGGDRRPNPAVTTTVPQPTVTTLDDHGGDNGGNGSGADDGTTQSQTSIPSTAAEQPAADGGTPTPVPTTAATAPTQTYTSAGGSIVVNFDGSVVSLSSSSPAAGFTAAVHDNGPTRVEVRFSDGQTEWRIRVDVVNGQLVPEITQH